MRALSGGAPVSRAAGIPKRSEYGWLQAGSSIAYRLAHLSVPRWAAATGLSALFYLV